MHDHSKKRKSTKNLIRYETKLKLVKQALQRTRAGLVRPDMQNEFGHACLC